ncbi:hypothetical protein I3843_13G031600 [Carya illinoinensis]|uniref:Uncharacterized protein n=1 Tax=Carya illinoinensis TaxID=32201 RepID=A0A8T1NG96_CARIL|nr:uncharacterized protein LOC122292451 [Carya illinoinensis]KAG2672305.1 hypothetical protein I3760_13G034300 [Carya illinoinensis]KAG6630669.1 hypothetical protein CIPAW_13G035000 [Carya illinoinensis]KAG6680300.1 hypothetical protein I3842_13G035100 [Carya illinoinensis]KAG7948881.1 hypothetical protein I3843_13G031600 [Carya illinoinensis]
MEGSLADMLMKVAIFALVQALVYLILSKSSTIFSKDKKNRSLSFRRLRSTSINRIIASLGDMPSGGEPSPSSRSPLSPIPEESKEA